MWTSLVAQKVKSPPTMPETQVQTLGWDDPLEKGMATRSSMGYLQNSQNVYLRDK